MSTHTVGGHEPHRKDDDILVPPVALTAREVAPAIGIYRRLKAVITDPVGMVERSAAAYGDIFTIKIPFSYDVTYVLGYDAYRTVTALPAGHAAVGPVFAQLPTVGYWFPRASDDIESLQQLIVAGRKIMAQLLTPATNSRLARLIPDIVMRHTQAWNGRVDLAGAIYPIVYEAACRSLLGEIVWNDIGKQIVPLYRAIVDGVDVSRASLAKTPLHIFMPEYRATKKLYRVLREARRRHVSTPSPLFEQVARARQEAELDDADMTWMIMYVLWNATAYPGSYAFWTLIDVLQRPGLLTTICTERDSGPRQELLSRCFLETLRMNPVSMLVRSLVAPLHTEVNGKCYRIPAGSLVAVYPGGINRDSALSQDPQDYSPDRYLTEPPSRLALFGRGPFGCVAREFSRLIIAGVLDQVLRQYRLTLTAPPPSKRCRVGLLYPAKPLRAYVAPTDTAARMDGPRQDDLQSQ